MRRIQLLVLGVVGVLGVTLAQTAAQPAPVLPPPPSGPALAPAGLVAPPVPGKAKDVPKPGGEPLDLALPPLPAAPSGPPPAPPTESPKIPDPIIISAPPPGTPAATPKVISAPPPAPPTLVAPEPPPELKPALKPTPKPPAPEPTTFAPVPAAPPMPSNRVAPGVSLETVVPDAVPLGKDATYEIVVRNNGPIAVSGVRVEEEVPNGARYLGGEPLADVTLNTLRWTIGDMAPGAERRMKVTVKPGTDGDFKSSPRVTATATTTNTVRITRPKVTASVTGPEVVGLNDEAAFAIVVKNEGSGPAAKVKVHVALPPGLKHPQSQNGAPVEAELANVAPGEVRNVVLKTRAVAPGQHTCELTVLAEGSPEVKAKAVTMVQNPMLEARLVSAGRATVRGEPVFTLEIANPGNATTPNVQAAASFPEGLEFVSASDGGNYEPGSRTVTWNLGPQAAGAKKNVTLKLRAGLHGKLAVRSVVQAGSKLKAEPEAIIQVEGVPAINFEVVNIDNPAEVGKEVTYEIRVLNQGTRPLTNVRIMAGLTEGLQLVNVTGPTKHQVTGQAIGFEPIPRLAVKADVVIRIKVKGTVAGDLRCKVHLACDEFKQPIFKAESTTFQQN